MSTDRPRVSQINLVKKESPTVKTFRVSDPPSVTATPGQFVLVWVPGSGEIPLAISRTEGEEIDLTVKLRGETTEQLHGLGSGDRIGIRGPYGHGFSEPEENNLIVGGGYGVSPLKYLHQEFSGLAEFTVAIGASTEAELLFLDRLQPEVVATEDGTKGEKGNITEVLGVLLEEESIDKVYTAGPEPMIYAIFEICRKRGLKLEASLERIMKCGVGLCGSCLIDGFRVCQDGPVADLDQLARLDELGTWTRGPSGRKERI